MDFFKKVGEGIEDLLDGEKHSHTRDGQECDHPAATNASGTSNRWGSFAPQSSGQVKWYVDGCSYFWAVSQALEAARETIYIMDWWLTPEIYLRRPPSRNEQYRLDNMLKAAAERGVQVRVIVYKEVTQALTLNSEHTKHALEALHPNIRVFRHPDHLPRAGGDIVSGLSKLNLNTFNLAQMGGDTLEALYGSSDDVVLFWAHHEKLCLVDDKLAFMGGLDMCFGRWDTQSHPIADAHPENLDDIVFPGQDYNNARVYDFEDVSKWENNKLDRTKSSRMGWSDISISLAGSVVNSLRVHFMERWNFIYNQKYTDREYQALSSDVTHIAAPISQSRGHGDHNVLDDIGNRLHNRMHGFFGGGDDEPQRGSSHGHSYGGGQDFNLNIQVVRSSCAWSAGTQTEHSIADAYRSAILNAEHFIYIENQFFITATSDEQKPVTNKIGGAIVERIVRAHREGAAFHVTVVMPAVPAFAGDLQAEGALGTRAIMEFQYNSINRGGHSIVQALHAAGIDNPEKYIGFYNLRNYDRINVSPSMQRAEETSGVRYEDARREHDDAVTNPYSSSNPGQQYQQYQDAASSRGGTWDTVSACYMNDSQPLTSVPWPSSDPESEADAFVSEELYVHSKVLIADDRLVICGSANLNDRSQMGNHDSEIAVVIEDDIASAGVESTMNGTPYRVGRFASSLRRTLYQKHLGLLPDQKCDRPDGVNWSPIAVAGSSIGGQGSANAYDWDSPADALVSDPLSNNFLKLWTGTARENTSIFSDVFQCVPNDKVRTWADYDSFFSRHFVIPGMSEEDLAAQRKKDEEAGPKARRRVDYGHVPYEARERLGGVRGVKEALGRVRGNLVEMPLAFLIDVDDIAKEGLSLNALTDELYT